FPPFRRAQVQHDAAFAAVEIGEHAAAPLGLAGADIAGGVAVRAFHLDHVGAQIGQDLGAVGPHQDRGQVKDAHPGKRAVFLSGAGHAAFFPATWAARSSVSRCAGCAISMRALARWLRVLPRRSAAPYSVMMTSTSLRAVVTGPDSCATMRLTAPFWAVLGSAMMDRPPGEADAART